MYRYISKNFTIIFIYFIYYFIYLFYLLLILFIYLFQSTVVSIYYIDYTLTTDNS